MDIIGVTTGWMFARWMYDFYQQQQLLEKSGVNAVELPIVLADERRQVFFKRYKTPNFPSYVSLHLDDYSSQLTVKKQVVLARVIFAKQKPHVTIFHPNAMTDEYLEALVGENIFLAAENMDKNKEIGHRVEELRVLMERWHLGFILDIQHAFEHDASLAAYAWDLFQMGKDRLRHLHVSGQAPGKNHALVHQSENAGKILEFTGRVLAQKKVPIILEGEYKNLEELKKEVDFLKKELFGQ